MSFYFFSIGISILSPIERQCQVTNFRRAVKDIKRPISFGERQFLSNFTFLQFVHELR